MQEYEFNNPDWLYAADPMSPRPHPPKQKRHTGKIALLLAASFTAGVFMQPFLYHTFVASDSERAFRDVYAAMDKKWLYGNEIEHLDEYLWEAAMAGMTSYAADPYTGYRGVVQTENRMNTLSNARAGIGVQVTYTPTDQAFFVVHPVEGEGAEKAGILPHDRIIAVNGAAVADKTMDDLVNLLSGEPGTEVQVTVDRAGEELVFPVIRSSTSKRTASATIEGDVGILSITSFSGTTGKDVETALAKLEAQGIDKLIIDLRDNGGGLLDACAAVATHLTDEQEVLLLEEDRLGNQTIGAVTKANTPTYHFDRIVVLVNGNTASASEVLALYLRETLGAVIVGETTFGKGVVQNIYPLPNGGSLTMTELRWLSPSGVSINGVGITPDVKAADASPYLGNLPILVSDETYAVGSSSEICAAVQVNLQLLGYGVDRTDGVFSPETEAALRAYQDDSPYCETDGLIGNALICHLNIDAANYLRSHPTEENTPMAKALETIQNGAAN